MPPTPIAARSGTPRLYDDIVSDDKCRVKTNTELPDQTGIVLLVSSHLLQELGRARFCDRAEMLDDLFARHADAVIGDAHRIGIPVQPDTDAEIGIFSEQVGVRERFEAQLVRSIGGIGGQLTEKDLLVAVQRMDHQVEKLANLGLEAECFPGTGATHALLSQMHKTVAAP